MDIKRIFASTFLFLLVSNAHSGTAPSQWIAKQYTEMLGRAPTSSEWITQEDHFSASSTTCNSASLSTFARGIAESSEFLALYPDTTDFERAARASALVRATLSHEVNSGDWSFFVDPYATGSKTWSQTLDTMYSFTGFVVRANGEFCDAGNPNYGFGHPYFPTDPIDLYEVYSGGTSRTQAALQADLNSAAPGSTVYLNPGEVVTLGTAGFGSGALTIPFGVKLETFGYTDGAYAAYGRLEAATGAFFCLWYICTRNAAISMEEGASIEGVWVDGRDIGAKTTKMSLLLLTRSSLSWPSKVISSRFSGLTAGGAAITLEGGNASVGVPCTNALIRGNLVTGYDTTNGTDVLGNVLNASGIRSFCGDALIENNDLVDLTGVAMSLHGSVNRVTSTIVTQQSDLESNTILQAGLSAASGIAVEPIGDCWPASGWIVGCVDLPNRTVDDVPEVMPFTGAELSNNAIFSGPYVHTDIGVILGGDPRWGDHRIYGNGVVVTGLTSGLAKLRTNIGVAVAGMINSSVGASGLDVELVDGNPLEIYGKCPQQDFVASSASSSSLTSDVTFQVNDSTDHCAMLTAATFLDPLILDPSGSDKLVGSFSNQQVSIWGLRAPSGNISEHWNDLDELAREFREIRLLGANAARLKLLFHTIISAPSSGYPNGTPNTTALAKLVEVVDLAKRQGLYVVISGLRLGSDGDNGDWYDIRTEAERWSSQRVFWESVTDALLGNTAIAYFDLMNEPVSPTAPVSTWCVNPSGDAFCFAQYLTKDLAGRSRIDLAKAWLETVVPGVRGTPSAVRDANRILAVGMFELPTSSGTATGSGFRYPDIAPTLDLEAGPRTHIGTVHFYPSQDDPMTTTVDELQVQANNVKAYKVSNLPLVIDEIYPRNNLSTDITFDFMSRVKPEVTGFIGQYLGKTPLENTPIGSDFSRFVQYEFGSRWLSISWNETGQVGATLP